MLKILKQPYPLDRSVKRTLIAALATSLFVGLFLALYQPFGLSEWKHPHKTAVLLLYGAVTLIVMLLFGFIPRIFNEEKWNVGKAIGWNILMILFIALGNLIYSNKLGIIDMGWNGFVIFSGYTLALAIFPVVVMVMLSYNRLLHKHIAKAIEANAQIAKHEGSPVIEKVNKLVFIAENGKDKLELIDQQLLFIESADNYSSISFIENGKVKKVLIRSSLKRIEEQIAHPGILRCHRTFIVNLQKVIHVSGNSQGYKLHFDVPEITVPVSRTLGKEILEKLKQVQSVPGAVS